MASLKKRISMKQDDKNIMQYIESRAEQVEKTLREYMTLSSSSRYVEKLLGRSGYKYDSEALKKGILEPAMWLLDAGGKRWRPVLMLLTMEALGKSPDNFVEFSLIPEIIHNATLVHDDIEDNSPMRRNREAVHMKFGTDIAINLGDFMYFFPVAAVVDSPKLSTEEKNKMLTIFAKEMTSIAIGQATDIVWHKYLVNPKAITEDNYLQMAFNKSGVLARFACKLGAVLGGADDETVEAIGKFGATIGVAFQLQDDVLNLVSSGVSVTKGGVGEDITEGKVTMLVIQAIKVLQNGDKKRLLEILAMHTSDKILIAEAIALIDKSNAKELVIKMQRKLVTDAWAEIEPKLQDSPAKDRMKQLADFTIERGV